MKNRLLNRLASTAAGILLVAGSMAKDARAVNIAQPAPVEHKLEKRPDYTNPTYPAQAIEDKLNTLYACIQGTPEDKENIKKLLKKLAQYGVGKRVIMQTPADITITVDYEGKLKRTNVGAWYWKKNILMPNEFDNPYLVICLAHEMCHARQDASGRLHRGYSPFPSDRFVQQKICELETKLQDCVLESQVKPWEEGRATPVCIFYNAELERYKKTGLTQRAAERAARTSVVQIYWTALREKPKGVSGISSYLRRDVDLWNNTYDLAALDQITLQESAERRQALRLDQKEVDEAEQIEQKQAKYEQDDWRNLTWGGRNCQLIPAYLEAMDINLSEKWLTSTQRDRTTVGDLFLVCYYPSGGVQSLCFCLPDGGLIWRDYSETSVEYPKKVVLHEVSFNQLRQKNGYELYYYPSGKKEAESLFKDGVEVGAGRYFFEDGTESLGAMIVAEERNGVEETRLANGDIVRTPYVNSKKHGTEEYICADGTRREILYQDDVARIEKSYNLKGVLVTQTKYDDKGLKTEDTYYMKNGRKMTRVYDKQGVILSAVEFNNIGVKTQETFFEKGIRSTALQYNYASGQCLRFTYDKEGKSVIKSSVDTLPADKSIVSKSLKTKNKNNVKMHGE